MLRYDPFAPLARHEMENRWHGAAQARLRRAAQTQRTPTGQAPTTPPHPANRLWRFIRLVRGITWAPRETWQG